jgi:short-subunit dehydrogenase
MRLEGRRVLVTGATGGIGGAIAREFASRACTLILTGRRRAIVESLVNDLGPPAQGFAADLTNLDEVHRLLAWADPVDVLVASAGVEIPQDLGAVSDAELEEAIRINLLAPAALARVALAPMIERGEGHIVLISSIAGLVATPFSGTVYVATKWGLRGLGLALRQELHGTGVGVSTIFPGPVRDVGMFARSGVALPRGTGTSSPEDVARAVARAIEHNRPETTVAPGGMRLSAALGAIAPVIAGQIARLAGAGRVREEWIAALNSDRPSERDG